MKKYFPFLLVAAAVAFYFYKKKAAASARVANNAPSSQGGQDIFSQLSGGLDQLLGRGKQNTTGIAGPSTGKTSIVVGSGSSIGTQLSGVGVNVGPLINTTAKAAKDLAKWTYDRIHDTFSRFFSTSAQKDQAAFEADNFSLSNPITDQTGKAGSAAVDAANANINFGGDPLSDAFDYNPDPWGGSNYGAFNAFNA